MYWNCCKGGVKGNGKLIYYFKIKPGLLSVLTPIVLGIVLRFIGMVKNDDLLAARGIL